MTEKQVMVEIKCPLSRQELLEIGEELAQATDELREIDRRKKEVAADLAAEQKRTDGRVFVLAKKVKDKFEFRQTPCIVVYGVPRAGLKTIRPVNTGLDEFTEPMTAEEMQQGLDFGTTAEGAAETPTQ